MRLFGSTLLRLAINRTSYRQSLRDLVALEYSYSKSNPQLTRCPTLL